MNLEIFKNNGYEIRGFMVKNEPYFVGKDIAECLGYEKPEQAVSSHVRDKHKITFKELQLLDTPQFKGDELRYNSVLMKEAGLYSLIMRSKLEKAEEFQDWVTEEVLPSIRKTGSYVTPKTPMEIINETLEMARKEIAVEKVKREEIEKFVDATMGDQGLITFEHATKLLHERYETNIGRNTLMGILRDNQVLQQNNRPYQRYMNWFKVIKKVTDNGTYDVTLVYEDKLRYINNYIH